MLIGLQCFESQDVCNDFLQVGAQLFGCAHRQKTSFRGLWWNGLRAWLILMGWSLRGDGESRQVCGHFLSSNANAPRVRGIWKSSNSRWVVYFDSLESLESWAYLGQHLGNLTNVIFGETELACKVVLNGSPRRELEYSSGFHEVL